MHERDGGDMKREYINGDKNKGRRDRKGEQRDELHCTKTDEENTVQGTN